MNLFFTHSHDFILIHFFSLQISFMINNQTLCNLHCFILFRFQILKPCRISRSPRKYSYQLWRIQQLQPEIDKDSNQDSVVTAVVAVVAVDAADAAVAADAVDAAVRAVAARKRARVAGPRSPNSADWSRRERSPPWKRSTSFRCPSKSARSLTGL